MLCLSQSASATNTKRRRDNDTNTTTHKNQRTSNLSQILKYFWHAGRALLSVTLALKSRGQVRRRGAKTAVWKMSWSSGTILHHRSCTAQFELAGRAVAVQAIYQHLSMKIQHVQVHSESECCTQWCTSYLLLNILQSIQTLQTRRLSWLRKYCRRKHFTSERLELTGHALLRVMVALLLKQEILWTTLCRLIRHLAMFFFCPQRRIKNTNSALQAKDRETLWLSKQLSHVIQPQQENHTTSRFWARDHGTDLADRKHIYVTLSARQDLLLKVFKRDISRWTEQDLLSKPSFSRPIIPNIFRVRASHDQLSKWVPLLTMSRDH